MTEISADSQERPRELADTRFEIIRRLGRAAGMSEEQVGLLLNASPMHDIGKIGIPGNILLKPGKLDSGQWEIMKAHPAILLNSWAWPPRSPLQESLDGGGCDLII